MNRQTRQAVELLKQARSGAYSLAQSQIDKAIKLISPPRKSAKAKAYRGARRERDAEKQRRREVQDGALRLKVAVRAGYLCELAWKAPHHGHEPHHLLSGSAKRIDEEPQNVMWVCRFHHDEYHRHRARFIREVKEWCQRHAYPVPERISRLERRLASLPPPRRVAT